MILAITGFIIASPLNKAGAKPLLTSVDFYQYSSAGSSCCGRVCFAEGHSAIGSFGNFAIFQVNCSALGDARAISYHFKHARSGQGDFLTGGARHFSHAYNGAYDDNVATGNLALTNIINAFAYKTI